MSPLERHRKALGLTAAQLAEKVGVTHPTILRWERGESKPQAGMYPAIAAALGISAMEATELIAPSDPEPAETVPAEHAG